MSDQLDFSLFPEPQTAPTIFAEVVIPLALPKNYTWSIPFEMTTLVKPGMRVEVVLGKHKKYAGIIKSLSNIGPTAFKPKPILNVLDDEPLVYEQQLRLWQWISSYYMCSEGEVMQAAIPANLKLSSESILIWNEQHDYDVTKLSDEEFLVTEALEMKKELRLQEVQQILDGSKVYPVIKRLI
ncbi:MAG: primosomal protein N', partial [Sphingobacteriia bacterium 35-40-5]